MSMFNNLQLIQFIFFVTGKLKQKSFLVIELVYKIEHNKRKTNEFKVNLSKLFLNFSGIMFKKILCKKPIKLGSTLVEPIHKSLSFELASQLK